MKPNNPSRLFNRELSWLFFNTRVLEEAENLEVPLLERVRFLSISASNLDEFYMVRVAGLREHVRTGIKGVEFGGGSPKSQLRKIHRRVGKILARQNKCWQALQKTLAESNINVLPVKALSKSQRNALRATFEATILPLLTPLSVDPAHPFPFLPNFGFGIVLGLEKPKRDPLFGVITIPLKVPRIIEIQSAKGARNFVFIEDVLQAFAKDIYPDFNVTASGVFRITRDSGIAVDERAEDLVQHFESLLKIRRRGRVIRLEINKNMQPHLKEFLVSCFDCSGETIEESAELLGLCDIAELVKHGPKPLLFPPFKARFPERIREFDGDCFAAIAAKDIVVHHPYEEFDVVIQFLQQAARDPDVVAIKQTLYRTSDNSPIVGALIDAAESGKNVTALVELKARFDEASNMRWARDLERAGVQVVYGFIGYKTHAKVSLVIRREQNDLQTYTHLGTGNYHEQNAKIYTDLALFTADKMIGEDVGKIFNFVTSYNEPQGLKKLAIAPLHLRETLMDYIDREILHARAGRSAQIWAKMNALVDPIIIEKLYLASQAGVKIDLVVRGICCLRPQVKGMSENIRVKSIIGRFLEHSRIACFGNGAPLPSDKALVFISSADWMPRNLNRRIETLVPVESPTVHNQILDQIMIANLLDNTNSWELQATGRYVRVKPEEGKPHFSAHQYFMENPSLSGRGAALAESAPEDLEDSTVLSSQIFSPKISELINLSSAHQKSRELAVIDIGSNSVRLVVYHILGAHFTPVYNEKILAGLGRDLRRTGCLSVEGKRKCRDALVRFSQIISARSLREPLIGATAALRVAEDAPDFVASILSETGLDISPISGQEEARLAALGLLSSNDRRSGIGADLGGASLELMRIDPSLKRDNATVQGVSLPLGPFDAIGGDLSNLKSSDYKARVKDLDKALNRVPGYLDGEDTLYLVGGAWRNLAAVHQQRIHYPMRTLQGYRLKAKDAKALAHWAWTDGIEELLEWPGLRKARAETLPYAGLMLERLIKRFSPKHIVISKAGLREGLVWNTFSEQIKSRDALIDGCRDFARGFVQAEHFGPPLYRFLSPLLPALPDGFGQREAARLLQAACHLAGLGKNLHPDYRAELVFEDVLYAPVAGLTHAERAFLSLSLFRTYTAKRESPAEAMIRELLSEKERRTAAFIGEAIRLGIVVTGRTPGLLSEFELQVNATELVLLCAADRMPLVTDRVHYRVAKLAKFLGLEPAVRMS